jgi:uncharacterized protein YndB with AHSA1/START domain/DNA-binding transcriptional ArsR family regulator
LEDSQLGREEASASDGVFRALADPSRRQLLDRLNDQGGQSLRQLCAGLDMTRQSVSKHLAILETANLVATVRRGREKLHYLNVAPIQEMAERWINQFDKDRVSALSDLKTALESSAVEKPTFVYVTYIKTTPEKLWQALTEPAFTVRYWRKHAFESDWAVGSPMTWIRDGLRMEDPEQVVLESDPYRRLSYTWLTFTPEFIEAVGFSDEFIAQAKTEPRSKVAFDLEPIGEMVKLTVVHDGFDQGSAVFESIGGGWPIVLSGLKSLLETGEVEPF